MAVPVDNMTTNKMLLDELPVLSAGAVKAYLYLCSLPPTPPGQTVKATIRSTGNAIGRKDRATISALNVLVEKELIGRSRKPGAHANLYRIYSPGETVLDRPDDVKPLDCWPTLEGAEPELAQPDAVSKKSKAIAASCGLPSGSDETAPAPTSISDLVTKCYKESKGNLIAELQGLFPDETDLRYRLEWMVANGGVEPELPWNFFVQALFNFVR